MGLPRTFSRMTVGVALITILIVLVILDLWDRGVVLLVPAAKLEPLDLATLVLSASALVMTGVGIALAIAALFGFEQLKKAAVEAASEAGARAGEVSGREAGTISGTKAALAASAGSWSASDREGDEIAQAQPSEDETR